MMRVCIEQEFDVIVHNPSVISRVLNNENDQGVPQPYFDHTPGIIGSGWRDMFYNLKTEQEVLEHLAWCIGVNGWCLSQLDGWADCDDIDVEVKIV